MLIGPEREPRLEVAGGEPFAIECCEIRRDLDRSILTAVVTQSRPYAFTPGDRVTLWAGPSVVFEGRAVSESDVLDLMSCESDGELSCEETI